jgi:hypothetical protein
MLLTLNPTMFQNDIQLIQEVIQLTQYSIYWSDTRIMSNTVK